MTVVARLEPVGGERPLTGGHHRIGGELVVECVLSGEWFAVHSEAIDRPERRLFRLFVQPIAAQKRIVLRHLTTRRRDSGLSVVGQS